MINVAITLNMLGAAMSHLVMAVDIGGLNQHWMFFASAACCVPLIWTRAK